MHKEMVTKVAEWNLEMIKNFDAGMDSILQSQKETANQVKDLMNQGFDHVTDLTTRGMEQMVENVQKGTRNLTDVWNRAQQVVQSKTKTKNS